MTFLAIWECACGVETAIPLLDLQEIQVHQKGMTTGDAFVNFVCPQCGLGARRRVDDMPLRSLGPTRFRPALFHADLKCDVENCEAHATVHTQAESGKRTAGPKIPVPTWKLAGIVCYEGHPAKEPLEVISRRVTNPAGEDYVISRAS